MEQELVAYVHSGLDLVRAWLASIAIVVVAISLPIMEARSSRNQQRMIRQLERLRSSVFRLETILAIAHSDGTSPNPGKLPDTHVIPFAEREAEQNLDEALNAAEG